MSAVANVLGRAKMLTAAMAAVVAFLAFPAAAAHAAAAAPYPAPSSAGTVNTGVVGAHGEVTFSGSGFIPGEEIVVTVTPTSSSMPTITLTIKADRFGAFRVSVRMPTAGTFRLAATGQKSGHVVSATVKVVDGGKGGVSNGDSSTGAGKGGLSFTGSPVNLAVTSWLGVGAIGLGVAFLKLGATRRRQTLVSPTN